MEFPDLYRNVAFIPKRDANVALAEFTFNKKWRENACVIDLGSGDGSATTDVLQRYLPASYKRILGCDISKKMVQYANENFKTNRIEFMELDISKPFPPHLRGAFDHAFSSYTLQRIQQQKKKDMEFPDLYRNVAFIPKRDANVALAEFTFNNKWRENPCVIDLGSGDGSATTDVLQKYLPASYKRILGCDISRKMVQYANENFKTNRIEFMELDFSKPFPPHLKGAFDHAFSSYALQMMQQQKSTFQNIYYCLKDGGSCFLLILGNYPVYENFRKLSRKDKWAEDLKDVETFVSPYHDSQDPKRDVTSVLQSVGFKNVEVNVFEKTHTYENEDVFKDLVKTISPFHTLHDRWDEFMADYFELVPNAIKIDYQLIVAYGLK